MLFFFIWQKSYRVQLVGNDSKPQIPVEVAVSQAGTLQVFVFNAFMCDSRV